MAPTYPLILRGNISGTAIACRRRKPTDVPHHVTDENNGAAPVRAHYACSAGCLVRLDLVLQLLVLPLEPNDLLMIFLRGHELPLI